jgi:hypothetical protein
VIIVGFLVWILYLIACLQIREWKKTLAVIVYLTVIWTVLTEL